MASGLQAGPYGDCVVRDPVFVGPLTNARGIHQTPSKNVISVSGRFDILWR